MNGINWICSSCGLEFSSRNKLWKHRVSTGEAISRKHQYTCEYCGKTYNNKRKHDKECAKKPHGPHKWTEDERARLSNKLRNFYMEHPENNSWSFNHGKKSAPCEYLKELLRSKNYQFLEEVRVLSDRNYLVDILLPDRNVIIEVNGNQHYTNDGKSLLPYYQERHDLIEAAGYIIIEVPYKLCYKEDFFMELCSQLDGKLSPNQLLCKFESCQLYKSKKRIHEEYKSKNMDIAIKSGRIDRLGRMRLNMITNEEWERRKNLILNCGVDLNKFGCLRKLEEATGLTRRQIKSTISRFNIKYKICK